jgi:hypothetical protein
VADNYILGDPVGSTGDGYVLGPAAGRASTVDQLVNETAIPKGGVPVQLTQSQAAGFDLYDRLYGAAAKQQQALARERALDRNPVINAGISGMKQFANNYLALPAVGLDAATLPMRTISSLTRGELPTLFPTPQPNVDAIAAGLKSMTSPLTYNQARQNIDLAEGARQTVHPYSTLGGNIGGDIATIVAGRLPFARGIVAATAAPDDILAASRAAGLRPLGNYAQNVKRQMDIWWNSPWAAPIKRGLGKVAETSAENALLGIVHGDDPVKGAALGAAGQAAGSMLMTAGFRFPLTSASLGTLVSSIVAYQMLKAENPFNARDSLIKSGETVIGGMAGATVLGTVAAALGAGRFRGAGTAWKAIPGAPAPAWLSHEQARGFPKITDAINSAMRSGPNSVITQLVGDENAKEPVLGPVLDRLSKNTNLFKPAEMQKIADGVQKGTLRQTVIDMLKDPDFAARMSQ